MNWVFHGTNRNESSNPPPLVQYLIGPPQSPPPPYDQNFVNKISPSILWIIIILSVIFFVSGLLHLLVRLLIRSPRRDFDDLDNVTVLQGQLQQLFHLHDAGVDQSYIDTLPVFLYKSIIGAKDPFDCAVCLCEFEAEDKLRLLPRCCHAFHLECIDTWLLSHSTCPLCRGSLLPDFPSGNCSPVVLVLESGRESSQEIVDRDFTDSFSATHVNFQDGFVENQHKLPADVPAKEEAKVVAVKLGKLKNINAIGCGDGRTGTESGRVGESSSSISKVDSRRCYSMGAFNYVLDESSLLRVPIVPMKRKEPIKRADLSLTPGHGPTSSMCDLSNSQSKREGFKITGLSQQGSSAVSEEDKRESFSVSKIWLRSKKGKPSSSSADSSRQAFSFRLPMQRVNEMKLEETAVPEIIEVEGGMNQGDACALPRSECGMGQLNCGRHSLDSLSNPTPSFARRTLNLIVGRLN